MKAPTKKAGKKEEALKYAKGHNELKTDLPLSEKDEVKQAEEKMRKRVGKVD
ncbi:MAG: hypothetical protein ACTHMI_08485 [Mucilaginibacter sp.]